MGKPRTNRRITACDLVMVGWHDGIGKLNQLGNVEHLSSGDMGLLLCDDLPVGTPVTVTYGYGELGGIVRHSAPKDHGVFIGIEFDKASRNSMLHFQPELLIREL